ncbi:MAG: putative O-glycosylation ligase, exosortase A system-associated [Sphingomonadales bacterium]|nr:putative O-glycosylation ligase, exosortase A system-associated [Sphingomonadales bacterium]
MRDIFFILFLAGFLGAGLKRPFLLVLVYCYVDIVAPQKLSYYLVNAIPISLICFLFAVAGWLLADDKRDTRVSGRQILLLLLLVYCGLTTAQAAFPVEALVKWDWVWKALLWAMFLPLTLRTRLRIESLVLIMVLSVASIAISGGIKTVLSGGGYGVLQLLLNENYGLYEGSIMSTVGIAVIPIIVWLYQHGTVFPKSRLTLLFTAGLIFSCLLLPIGTQARTGLVCAAVLGVLMLRTVRYRFLYLGLGGALALVAIPFLPASFTDRMGTIQNYQADRSASTRIAVWQWTWDYAKDHPFGGGFDAYRANRISYETHDVVGSENSATVESARVVDQARAYHSSYFEMLGEQGYPGFVLWLLLHVSGIWQMERLRSRYRKTEDPDKRWIAPLATALENGQIVYMIGSLFVGIAFQSFIYMMLALQMGLYTYIRRKERESEWRPLMGQPSTLAGPATP